MKINRRVVIIVAAVLLLIVLIIGFANGLFIRKHGFGDQKYRVTVVKNVDDLEDRSFYIQKENGTYERPYVGDTTFTGASTSGKIRVAWFGKDYDRIPTMHRGEKVVYRSKYEFTPSFSVERFQDIGYTIGICGMSPTSTGRYAFSTNPESRSIDINSSAGFLYNLGSHTVTMEMIGDTDLRRGNISQVGTIVGLEQGKTYKADIYIGTEIQQYEFVADVRAFSSMEKYTIKDFLYEKNKVVSFEFPEYFNSGYYYVGGFGFVRYINSSKEYDESMAMNIPNPTGEEYEMEKEKAEAVTSVPVVEEVSFTVEKKENIKVSLHFDNTTYDGQEIEPPTARVLGESGSYILNPAEQGNELEGTFELDAGTYTIEIKGLAGRTYSYMVSVADKTPSAPADSSAD